MDCFDCKHLQGRKNKLFCKSRSAEINQVDISNMADSCNDIILRARRSTTALEVGDAVCVRMLGGCTLSEALTLQKDAAEEPGEIFNTIGLIKCAYELFVSSLEIVEPAVNMKPHQYVTQGAL